MKKYYDANPANIFLDVKIFHESSSNIDKDIWTGHIRGSISPIIDSAQFGFDKEKSKKVKKLVNK